MSLATLGIDLGLSGARAAVVDEAGNLLGRGRTAGKPWHKGPDLAEREPEEWHEEALAAGRMALDEAGHSAIAAIGIGALGPCPVLLDGALRALAPAPLFSLDRRAEATRQRLIASHALEPEALGPDHALPKLIWWREHDPALIGRAKWVVDATGFLVARLTGRAVMDPITAEDYVVQGIESPVPLPAPARADSFAGGLLPDAAKRLGLATGTPVTVGSYDSYVDIAGSGAAKPGEGCIVLGSTMILGRVLAAPEQVPGLRCQPRIGGGWFLGGWTSAAGSLLDWSRDLIGEDAADRESLASLMPGAGGLLVLPYFAGERAPIWDPAARGAILGATLATTREQLRRAMIDGVALSALDMAKHLPKSRDDRTAWRLYGGGARNAVLAQALADALARPLAVLAHAGEAMAPALLAFAAMGHQVQPRVAEELAPNGERSARFETLYAIYRGLYPALSNSMHALGQLAGGKEDR
jgi:xylulokinase